MGECHVDVPLREVHVPGARRPSRITPKAMGVLLALVDQQGRVVTRDALLAEVWPDTLPTNDVLTQAITSLRKAFGEERGDPRYIETIAKTGYRLLAPAEWLGAEEPVAATVSTAAAYQPSVTAESPVRAVASPAVPTPSPLRRRLAWIGAVLGAIALVALAYALLASRDHPAPTTPDQVASDRLVHALPAVERPDYRLITSSPGFEGGPSLSPDAAMVAYFALPTGQRGTAIMVQTTAPSPPRQLTQPPAGADDIAPAWSPDGREIAFERVRLGEECTIMVVPANGGTGRRVGRCDPDNRPSFDWTHDGRGLIFGSRGTLGDNRGLRVLDLASGEWRAVDYAANPRDIDAFPRYSPDGRWIVFVRNSPLGDFWRIPAGGGHATRLTDLRTDIGEWDFTPDGRALVFSRWRESESRLYRLDLDTGLVQDLGIGDGDQPAIAARSPGLAFSQQRNYFGLYRFDLTGVTPPERLFPSSGRDRLPAIAPDGRQLAFASDRSGRFGLWWGDLQKPDSLRLIEGVLPETRFLPDWSADSERLLVVGTVPRGGAPGLFEVTPASGRVARLPVPSGEPVQAAYVPGDGRRVLVVAGTGDGRLELVLYDRSATPWRRLAAIDDVSLAHVDAPRNRVLFTRPGRAGLTQADLSLSPGSIRALPGEQPAVLRFRQWTVAPDGSVVVIQRTPGCGARMTVLGTGESSAQANEISRCLDTDRIAASSGLSLSGDGRYAFVSISESLGGDIGFMTLPSSPEALWPGAGK
ncbi:biopolymer transporter Tol [Lysobacter bugurensis]|uniref:Biopolymer transporter Tol n=1 Tax=Cognatilysobacter bugurensis TaxID=543356 RepID=A0A918SZK1_9GAMM|nr:biopolymer transporter Tol [Lysobacter bugurensis]